MPIAGPRSLFLRARPVAPLIVILRFIFLLAIIFLTILVVLCAATASFPDCLLAAACSPFEALCR